LGKVRENKNTGVQKLRKMQKKNCEMFYADCIQQLKVFFCLLRSQIICISTLKFILPPLFPVRLTADIGISRQQIRQEKRFIFS